MSRQQLIAITPAATGWILETSITSALVFLSLKAAETTARALASRLADAGIDATIRLTDHAGLPMGTIHYYAAMVGG